MKKETTKTRITIANDTAEAQEFCSWLNQQGHESDIGDSTGNYVNDVWTDTDPEASEFFNKLWDQYCKS